MTWRIFGSFVLVLSFLLVGGGWNASAQKDPPPTSAKLLGAMRDAAGKTYTLHWKRFKNLEGLDLEVLYQWSHRWMEAERKLSDKKAAQTAALQAHYERMKELEKVAVALVKSGQGRASDASAATYFRLEAELWLAQAKEK
jgi:hypothetical protein